MTAPLYLATASGPAVRLAMANGELGQMVTPDAGNRITPGVRWALDNGCFNSRWTFDRWSLALDRHQDVPGCLWAVVPDVVGRADLTDEMWSMYWSAPKRRGYDLAYVAQNGCRRIPLGARALFIGGSTGWKLSAVARRVVSEAHQRNMWVHMGRVNSLRRLRYAADIGCHSVDGTYLAFGPDINLARLRSWLNPDQPSLFSGVA